MDLAPNATLLPMWVIYGTCIFILNFLVFKPTLQLLETRKKLTVGLDDEAQYIKTQTLAKLNEYEMQIAEAKKLAKAAREDIIKSAELQQKEIIVLARRKSDEHISKIKDQIKDESGVALGKLRGESQAIANAVIEKLIDRRAA
jgi:F0F1-type ATP synthase membrane subunit b/b'